MPRRKRRGAGGHFQAAGSGCRVLQGIIVLECFAGGGVGIANRILLLVVVAYCKYALHSMIGISRFRISRSPLADASRILSHHIPSYPPARVFITHVCR